MVPYKTVLKSLNTEYYITRNLTVTQDSTVMSLTYKLTDHRHVRGIITCKSRALELSCLFATNRLDTLNQYVKLHEYVPYCLRAIIGFDKPIMYMERADNTWTECARVVMLVHDRLS